MGERKVRERDIPRWEKVAWREQGPPYKLAKRKGPDYTSQKGGKDKLWSRKGNTLEPRGHRGGEVGA